MAGLGDAAQSDATVRTLLAQVGLTEQHASRRPWQLSGGERQRAAIARALVGGPELLILDEPVSSLDTLHRQESVDVLRRLRAERAVAILLVSHDLGLVRALCDRILVMHDGAIVDEMAAGPGTGPGALPLTANPRTRELVDAVRFFASMSPTTSTLDDSNRGTHDHQH